MMGPLERARIIQDSVDGIRLLLRCVLFRAPGLWASRHKGLVGHTLKVRSATRTLGPRVLCENPGSFGLCSANLRVRALLGARANKVGIVESSRCPPEGGRYKDFKVGLRFVEIGSGPQKKKPVLRIRMLSRGGWGTR